MSNHVDLGFASNPQLSWPICHGARKAVKAARLPPAENPTNRKREGLNWNDFISWRRFFLLSMLSTFLARTCNIWLTKGCQDVPKMWQRLAAMLIKLKQRLHSNIECDPQFCGVMPLQEQLGNPIRE